jgi:Uma2 family endonuclease
MNWLSIRSFEPERYTPSVDFTVVIGSRGIEYLCPDVSAVDEHISSLYEQIEDNGRLVPNLVEELWADIDLLLERRMFLSLDLQVSDAA